eukprot:386509-Alexandrium_andersonii.AAC.1
MSASLVGSEMCIRDRCEARGPLAMSCWGLRDSSFERLKHMCMPEDQTAPVSYTHLTLPTICSV